LDFKDGENIVIYRPGAIGDTLLDTPLIRALKEHFPRSSIIYFSRPPAIQILEYNKKVKAVKASILNARRVRKLYSPKIFMDLKSNYASLLASRLTGAKYRLGIYKSGREKFYNIFVYPPFGKIHYTVYHRLAFLEPLGIDYLQQSIGLEFPFPEKYVEEMSKRLKKSGISSFFMASHIRFDLPHRAWEIEKYCELFKRITRKYQFPILLIHDRSNLKEMEYLTGCGKGIYLAPETRNLFELGALLRLAGVFFGSDSGPKHIAISQNTPTFSLFFTELPEAWTPPQGKHSYAWKGLPCQPCWRKKCPFGTFDCIHLLSADEVFQKLDKFLSELK